MAVNVELGNAELLDAVHDPLQVFSIHLAKNAINEEAAEINLATFVECDFLGYEPIVQPEWKEVAYPDQTMPEIVAKNVAWQPAGNIVPQTAYAVYVTVSYNGSEPELFFFKLLEPPFTFHGQQDTLKQDVSMYATLDV